MLELAHQRIIIHHENAARRVFLCRRGFANRLRRRPKLAFFHEAKINQNAIFAYGVFTPYPNFAKKP